MEKSKFQFTNPILKRLQFVIHSDFVRTEKLDMSIKLKSGVNYIDDSDASSSSTALVSVTVCVGTQDNSTPFYIEAEEEAKFKWDTGSIDKEQAQILLNQNAVALLISYLRPIISNVTSASPYPAYNLPYINLTSAE